MIIFKQFMKILLLLVFCGGQALSEEHHSIWEMGTERGKVYLVGSVHMLREQDYPLPKAMEDAYNNSQIVVFETDMSREKEVQGMVQREGLCEGGKTLKDYLSSVAYKGVQQALVRLNKEPNSLDAFKPWLAVTSLSIMDMEGAGLKAGLGVDKYFKNKAEHDGKGVAFLEHPEEQIQILIDVYEKKPSEKVLLGLGELTSNGGDVLNKLLKYWKQGDSKAAYEVFAQSFGVNPESEDILLTRRNKKWVPIIESLAKEDGDLFVVVGMGHLSGPYSVIHLFQNKGYKVKQL